MDIKKIREAVKVLSTITDSEWEKIEEMYSEKFNTEKLKTVLNEKENEKIVTELLKQVGVPSSIKGYYYIREAIILQMKDMLYHECITKELYPTIAKKFKSTSSRVERAIRHAIEVAWERGNQEIHDKIFGCTISGRPTNSEAISAFAEYIKMYM